MKIRLTLLLVAALFATSGQLYAQNESDTMAVVQEQDDEILLPPAHRHDRYFSNGLDAGILSAASIEKPGTNRELSHLRFSFIANLALHFNYDFDPGFGMFIGLGIKNIGFTESIGDSIIKRRVYTIGVPIGFKVGDIMGRNYVFGGGGVDVPFNYREKGIKDRHKTRSSEFFSDKTASVMPYLFAGACLKPGITLKGQFYPSNFFNVDYEEANAAGVTTRPFRGYDARLLLLSLGVDIHYRKSEKPTNTPQ